MNEDRNDHCALACGSNPALRSFYSAMAVLSTLHSLSRQFRGTQVRHRSALITGGAKGLGEAIARRLVKHYSQVTVADVDETSGRRLEEEFVNLRFVHADVSKPQDVANAVEVAANFGGGMLHSLVNNAGVVGAYATYADYELDEWHRVLNVNLNGVFYGLKYGLAHMVEKAKHAEDDPNFAIVNLCSTAGCRGVPHLGAYTAAKWAIRGMTQAAAVEYGPYKVRINAIAPTAIETPLTRQFVQSSPDPDETRVLLTKNNALPGFPQPEDVAGACAFLLSKDARYITGHTLPVDAGVLSRLF